MPRVPTYQPNQVGPVETTQARFQAANNNGGVAGGLAEGLKQSGNALSDYADAQDRLNAQNDDTQARLISSDAGVKYTQAVSEYGQLQSSAAREAQPVYTQKIDAIRDDALAQASNPRMRRFLEERIGALHADSEAQISAHAIKQQTVEANAAYDSQILSYGEQAKTTDNPVQRDKFIASAVSARRDQLIKMEGMDPEKVPDMFANEELKVASQIHAGVLDKMFSVPDPDINAIAHYVNAYGDEMTADLKAKTMTRLQKPLQDRQANSDADLAMGLVKPEVSVKVAPDSTKLDAITAQSESGNREYTASGQRITSTAGARGLMQVMPSTAADPGFGIKPSDGTPEGDARVGREYRAKMEERYGGDLQKMWAAYNWGARNVDKAVKEYGDNWLSHAPAETQKYVLANVAAAGGSGHAYTGTPQQWDKASVYATLDKEAAEQGWTPERVQRARAEVDKRIQRDDGLLKDRQSQADNAVAALLEQKGDSFRTSMVPPQIWAQLDPKDKLQYEKIETALQKPKDPPANSDTVVALHRMAITAPDQFASLNLEKYRPFVTAAEFDELGKEQARAARPANAYDPRPKIDATISRQKNWSGIDVDKDATEGFRVRRYMESQADAAKASGKEPTQQDYDRWFSDATKTVNVQRSFLGIDALAPDTTDRASRILSQPYRDLIRREFRQVNGRWPTEDETQAWFDKMGKPSS